MPLIVHSETPFNAEPPLATLRAHFLTPQPDFYVRSHGNIPALDPATYRLTLAGQVATPLDLSLHDLKSRFPHHTVTATMQCAGNRRADMQQVRPTTGDPWSAGAIGNAEWTGIRLADLLDAADADPAAAHIAFDSADEIDHPEEGRFTFGISIPAAKARAPETLLAWSVNGEDLAPHHGYPLRLVVPGYAGIRSAKWLKTITVQSEPSPNHMQQRDYKLLPASMTSDTIGWSEGITIEEMPLNAAICEPAAYAELPAGPTRIRGYATATARRVTRVDISTDGGRTWSQATLTADRSSPWAWTFWETTLDLQPGDRDLVVRAWDSASQTQPATPDETWNCKGYLSAAQHRIRVRVRVT
ncbi:MAG: molybdopterin-dependent oxidoreductase [Janthinobacterium lividum]